MAEEVHKDVAQQVEEVVVVPDVPQPQKSKEPPLPQVEAPASEPADADDKFPESGSFKEETTKVADLPDPEKKALEELKLLIKEALDKHQFTDTAAAPAKEQEKPPQAQLDEKNPNQDQGSSGLPADAPKPPTQEPEKPLPEENIVAEVKQEEEKLETVLPPEEAAPSAEVVETVVVTQVVEENTTTDAGDDDGAKTVEAIEETIVAVSSAVPPENPPPPADEPQDKVAQPPASEPREPQTEAQLPPTSPEQVSIWGVPLLADERTDVILLKFLRARDFKVKDAFAMIKNTVRWRKDFGIDELLEQDLGNDLDKVVFMHGFDKEGHPVCYNVFGEFQDKELYQKTFSDEEKRQNFLRWRIQFLEKSIRKLDFSPGGISTMVQVNDLKNSPGPAKWELRQATKQALHLLQDNYPEFVAKQVFINVPWWYLAVNRMISPFLTQRTKSKFVFAGPSKSAEALFRYIAADQVPVRYGGLSKDGEFGTTEAATEITVKPAAKHTVELPVTETCLLNWEIRVVGWDVSYGAEFVPSAEESYTVIIQKSKRISPTEEPVICNSFKVGEPGKIVLTINNPTSKKKLLLYRWKTKLASD